jgi:hypothetical protein
MSSRFPSQLPPPGVGGYRLGTRCRMIAILILVALTGASILCPNAASAQSANCYQPIPGGWEITISSQLNAPTPANNRLGVVQGNARLHRRPLYPPADKSLIWSGQELTKLERYGFRPLVLAYNEPRFLFDFHSAGGLLGHLRIGLTCGRANKWFHEWSELRVRYVDGGMEYVLEDPDLPGVEVSLVALPLADAAGLVVKVSVKGLKQPGVLVWGYGGASAFFTNYAMDAPEFSFAPQQCAGDVIACGESGFVLRRAFQKSDVYMNEVFAAARYLTNWQAVIRGGSSWPGRMGYGPPEAFTNSPGILAQSAQSEGTAGPDEKRNCVAVQSTPLEAKAAEGFVIIGMGGNILNNIRSPKGAWAAAQSRNRAIADRIVTRTPDPHLDAAVRMMAFATEGTWGDSAILHGAWSWRFAYLGWRGWYGSTCYGWTDRVKRSIQNHTRLGVVHDGPDKGGLGSLLEYNPGIYYNMNEVFLDQVRQYFDYTDDVEFMREIFPVLTGILDWENRRLQPKNEFLYENSLNTWISDSHWYIQGQCTQASAYMLRAHRLVADLARRLGKDPAPFEQRAAQIRAAVQRTLWQPRAGVFAEYRDTRGEGLLHPEPELPTIYHSAEFEAADPLQIRQMVHWAATRLRWETTPANGRLVWSSNWYPNRGRSYTHSTYELAYGEELNFALTQYLAGRADDAYSILRGTLCGIFNGPTPGGLSCHSQTDGRQRANDEFTDAISMWGRAVVEGLFGIVPHRPQGFIQLNPQFPGDWNRAEIDTAHLSYKWRREPGRVFIDWKSPMATSIHLRLPVQAAKVTAVRVDGRKAAFTVTEGFDGLSWVEAHTDARQAGRIQVNDTPRHITTPTNILVKQGEQLVLSLPGMPITKWRDPQSVLSQVTLEKGILRAIASGNPGDALAFVFTGGADTPTWLPLKLEITPKTPVAAGNRWRPPQEGGRDLKRWTTIDLSSSFNAAVTEVLKRITDGAQPPPLPASQVGFGYWKDHLLQYHGSRNQEISDAAWRAKVGPDDIAWTTDGIPFNTRKSGPNIAVVTRAGVFPAQIEFPVKASGRKLYLMISGMTFPVQSHVVNLRLRLKYADGAVAISDLANPTAIGDCWSTWCGRFHDTAANGFENIGGRSGPAGSAEVADLTQPVALDTEAHLVELPLRVGIELQFIELTAIANDCIFGLMGTTILK